MTKNEFTDNLVRALKEAGQDIVDNAEEYVGEARFISSMTITVFFDPETKMPSPYINVEWV